MKAIPPRSGEIKFFRASTLRKIYPENTARTEMMPKLSALPVLRKKWNKTNKNNGYAMLCSRFHAFGPKNFMERVLEVKRRGSVRVYAAIPSMYRVSIEKKEAFQ